MDGGWMEDGWMDGWMDCNRCRNTITRIYCCASKAATETMFKLVVPPAKAKLKRPRICGALTVNSRGCPVDFTN